MTDMQILLRFAVVTVLTILAVMAIGTALRLLVGYEMGSGLGIVTIVVPALEAGQTHARRTGAALASRRMWRLSGLFAAVSFVLSGAIALSLSALVGLGNLDALVRGSDGGTLAVMALVLLAVYGLAARFFLGWGQRLELNRPKD